MALVFAVRSTKYFRIAITVSKLYHRHISCLNTLYHSPHRSSADIYYLPCRWKNTGQNKDLSSLFHPLRASPVNKDSDNIGAELSGTLNKADLLQLLNTFYQKPEIRALAAEKGLDRKLFHEAYISFRQFCSVLQNLNADLYIIMNDIIHGAGHVNDIFPYFLQHAREVFPHLVCMDDLKKISDLRLPANWYPEARAIQRKIIFHAGPTNSGKTYHALQRFLTAKSGVYCGPLKLLAVEVFHKSNNEGTPCDLVTGEERRFANEDETSSEHVASTIEMTNINMLYEVAVIDEIQMIKDVQRGWAWTRALLGICAEEIHLCGEASSLNLVQELTEITGDTLEVRRYKRLTSLKYLDKAVGSFSKVRPGDCFVCFSKKDIFYISQELEKRGNEVAVIYGGLPPGTKLAQAQKFNDPSTSCKIMVATDAIGMGLNLSIKRMIFYSIMKPKLNEKGEKEMDILSPSQALQIAGRAGRYNTEYEDGEVTTFKQEDLSILKDITSRIIEPIEQAGLHPTADQIELFAYHLPNATLSNLMDIFVTLSQLDSNLYFMCNIDDFKFLADMIEHVPLSLRVRYVFCCSPIPKKQPFVCTGFLKVITGLWPHWSTASKGFESKKLHLFCFLSLMFVYLSFCSYRFPDMFPDIEQVRYMQHELDSIIQVGVFNITSLLKSSKQHTTGVNVIDDDEDFDMRSRLKRSLKSSLAETNEGDLEDFSPELLEDYGEYNKSITSNKKTLTDSYVNAKNLQSVGKLEPGQGKLTAYLLKKGLLTPKVLRKLQEEWSLEANHHRKKKK
ncbi:ATP-dependent RNA helicase SUPV3L1, mitochondrial [Octopus sinensis]|uniref:RNA helicase n=1 Tax=Octopus sinensis TaxID=2607531 RepID=A0A7E6ETP6_9MOLL|nr:ATP-dependent RNA helicase SUPV3L1, mitochondrial [Octopus sinensis]